MQNREKRKESARLRRLNNPERVREIARNWYARNKEKGRASARAWYHRNKDSASAYRQMRKEELRKYHREWRLVNEFGITTAAYEALVLSQEGRCALCGTNEFRRAGAKNWNIDHCHKTGAVRGLLCTVCNIRLGVYEVLRDTIGFDAVEQYLTKARTYGSSNNGYTGSVPARPKHPARKRAAAGDDPVIE